MYGYTLRDYQQQAVDSVWSFLCRSQGNPVVVLPTGAGKSIVIAELAKGAATNGLQVLILAHRKELLEQNAEKIRSLVSGHSVGVYSAGLRSRDTDETIVLAGIQSVHKRAFEFGARHLVIVDEAHLIPDSDSGMYRQFLADLRVSCPPYRLVGLTATPYRLDSGVIYGSGQIFDEVCIDVSVSKLIEDGYLSPITAQPVKEVDTSGLHRRAGEFIRGEMEELFQQHVVDACHETVALADANDRKKVIVFCSGVQHAEHVGEILRGMGQDVGVVTGETPEIMRGGVLSSFRSGPLRWLINVDVLTTGFDSPNIDCIAVMRATESAGLFAQIVGRGLRKSPGKTECLVLDFGGNIRRHGPIDAKDYGNRDKKKRGGSDAEGPVKKCPACSEDVPAGLRECYCGFRFPDRDINQDPTADKSSPILQSQQAPEVWIVEGVAVARHEKKSDPMAPPTMRVSYECVKEGEEGNLAAKLISEWVCIQHDHKSFAWRKAWEWWKKRCVLTMPNFVDDAVELLRDGWLADTKSITTVRDGKYYRIVDHVLDDIPIEAVAVSDDGDSEVPF